MPPVEPEENARISFKPYIASDSSLSRSCRWKQALRITMIWPLLLHGYHSVATIPDKHPVTLGDLTTVGSPDVTMQLSPDGNMLAYALDNRSINLIKTNSEGPSRQIGRGFMPLWSPEGTRLAYYSTTGDGLQISIYDLRTNKSTLLTHVSGGIDPDPETRVAGRVHDAFRYSWSPDGKYLVFATRMPTPKSGDANTQDTPIPTKTRSSDGDPLILTNTTPPDWTLSGVYSHRVFTISLSESRDGHTTTGKTNAVPGRTLANKLFIVNAYDKSTRQVGANDGNYFNPAWSPNGRDILCAFSAAPGAIFGASSTQIYMIDASTGKERPVTNEPGIKSRPSWSPNGEKIAYLQSSSFLSRPQLYVGNANAGFINVTTKLDRHVYDFTWFDDTSLLILYKDGVSAPLGQVDIASGQVHQPTGHDSGSPITVLAMTTSKSHAIAWEYIDPATPGTIKLLSRDGLQSSTVKELFPQAHHWNLGNVSIVRWRNRHGDAMEGTLLAPANNTPGRKYPMVVDVYPLIGGADWYNPMGGNQVWASMGYFVFRPSPRAPHVWFGPWKSESWSLGVKRSTGWLITLDDVMSGVDAVIARRSIDPDKMCLYGFSNGGGVVNYLITQTNRFRCAISVAPAVSDWIRPVIMNTGLTAYSEIAGMPLQENINAYIRLSPVFHLKSVATPVLLADGDEDGEFLLNSIEMYNGLRQSKVPVTLLRYPMQSHGFKDDALNDFWKRESEFLSKYLSSANNEMTPAPTIN